MPFCYAPWNNLDISPTGDMSPCCKFQQQHYNEKFNIQTHTIQQYKHSDFLQQVKQDFQSDQWPAGCERCQLEEQNHIASKRNLDWTRWQQHYEQYDLAQGNFITASVAFGNTCNLKCITCGPSSSSLWNKEAEDLLGRTVQHFKFYKQNFVSEFVQAAPEIIHLDIPGGEPFLSGVPEQKALLKYYVDLGQAHRISLHYTTNATVFPDEDWWQLWQHFKEIDVQISIDGIGARYEYIRYPGQWSTLLHNVDRYQQAENTCHNLRLSVSHTVSAYNVLYLDEFFAWCKQKSLPTPWLGRVHSPKHMRPTVWPVETRQIIAQHLAQSSHEEVKKWAQLMLNHDDSHGFELFKQRLRQHDTYRKLNFDTVFPELVGWV